MNDIPGVNPSLYAQPLGGQQQPGILSRHPVFRFFAYITLWYLLFYCWRLSESFVRRTGGAQALRSYRRVQGLKFTMAAVLALVISVTLPFADPVTQNTAETVFGFALVLFLIAFPVAALPVVFKAWRELNWRQASRR